MDPALPRCGPQDDEKYMQFRRLEIIPTVFFLCAVATLCTLGSWQLSRLAWKEKTIAETNAKAELPALASLPQSLDDLTYRKVKLTGLFQYEHTIHLIGRQQGMNVGYYMITPLVLEDDGRVILVNRGFSPPGEDARPQGLVTVDGILRPLREKRYFAPANNAQKNIWSWEDLDALEASIGKKPLPLVVEATGAHKEGVYPIPNDGTFIFRNDHLGYAVTWFGLALVSVVMFAAYYRKK